MLLIIAISFVLLTPANTENSIENVYFYEGFVSFDKPDPAAYTSITKINADIHVLKRDDDEYWMCLKNVQFMAVSGDFDRTEWAPISNESEAITLPFIYNMYSEKGRKGIITSKDDPSWSRNIKKAIADLFFNDKRVYDGKNQTFQSDDGFDYYVLSSKNNVHVKKMMASDMFQNHAKETNDDVTIEDYFPLPLFRKFSYDIDPTSNELNKIIAVTKVEYKPFNGVSEMFEVMTKQKIVLRNKHYSEMTEMDRSNMVYSEVNFDKDAFLTEAGGLDLSKGKIKIDMDETVKKLIEDLKQTIDYLNKSHITLSKALINDNEHIDSVIRRLKYLDEKHLLDIYSSVSINKGLSEILLKMISILGTPASCMFIVDMIIGGNIEGEDAVYALSYMPVHAFILPLELKNKLITLTKDEYSNKINRQAVLTLSNLVSKSVNKPSYEYNDVVESFIEELKGSKLESDQLLYMYALRNIRSERTIDEMILIAQGAKNYNHLTTHTRAESLYRLDRTLKGEDTLWMLFANKNEQFEIRASAMNALVSPDRPMSIDKIFWILHDSNDDDEINHLFATKLKMLSEIQLDRYEKIKTRAIQLKSFFEIPHISPKKSASDIFQFIDSYIGVGSIIELTHYGNFINHNFTSVQQKVTSKSNGPTSNTKEYHFFLKNVNIPKFTISMNFFLENIGDIGVEVVSIDNGRVLSYRYYNVFEIHKIIIEDFNHFGEHVTSNDNDEVENTKLKHYLMDLYCSDEILIPTDMGIPMVFKSNAGYIAKLDLQFGKGLNGNGIFDFVYRGSETYGFTSYNPISDTWNGIRRVKTSDIKLPLKIDYKLNMDQKSLKLTLKKNDEPFGFQSFVYSHVFFGDTLNGEIVNQTCPNCEMDNLISNGKDKLEDHVYLENDCEDTGYNYKFAVYDCEQRVTASYLSMTNLDKLWNLVLAFPKPEMCGVGFMVKNSEKYPTTQLEATIRLIDDNKEDYVSYQIFKVDYNVKNDDKLIKSWNLNYLNAKQKQSYKNKKFSAIEIKEGSSTYKFCYETTDKLYHDHSTTSTEITAGNDDSDEKCPKSESVIKIETKEEQSEEMKTADLEGIFTTCDDDSTQSFSDCLREVTSYRHYTIDVTHKNLTLDMEYFYRKASDVIREYYNGEFIRLHKHPEIAENEIKIFIDYPLYYKTLNVTLMDHNEAYRYDDIEVFKVLSSLFFTPSSTFAGGKIYFYSYCEAGLDYVTDNPDGDNKELTFDSNGQAMLAQLNNFNNETEFMVRLGRKNKDSKQLELYLQNGEDVAELSFKEDFELKINNKVMKITPNVTLPIHDSFNVLMTYRYEENRRVFVNLVDKSVTVEYTRDRVRISILNGYTGECQV